MKKDNRSSSYFKYVFKELYGLVIVILTIIICVCLFFYLQEGFTINGWGSLISGIISVIGSFILGSVTLYQSKLFSALKKDFDQYQRRVFEPKIRLETFDKLNFNFEENRIQLMELIKKNNIDITYSITKNKIYMPILIYNFSDFNIQIKKFNIYSSLISIDGNNYYNKLIDSNNKFLIMLNIKKKLFSRTNSFSFEIIYESFKDGYTYKKRYDFTFNKYDKQISRIQFLSIKEEIM